MSNAKTKTANTLYWLIVTKVLEKTGSANIIWIKNNFKKYKSLRRVDPGSPGLKAVHTTTTPRCLVITIVSKLNLNEHMYHSLKIVNRT